VMISSPDRHGRVTATWSVHRFSRERRRGGIGMGVGMDEPARILLGERDTERRRLIATVLRDEGYEVVETDDGRTLLGYAEYLAATCGRRGARGAIVADSFAIVAGE